MKISAILHTGDHSADIAIALDVDESTTLGELAEVLRKNPVFSSGFSFYAAKVEIRLVRPKGES